MNALSSERLCAATLTWASTLSSVAVTLILSNFLAFEPYRSGSRCVNHLIYTALSLRHILCRCGFRFHDFVESFTEGVPSSTPGFKALDEEGIPEEGEEKVILETR